MLFSLILFCVLASIGALKFADVFTVPCLFKFGESLAAVLFALFIGAGFMVASLFILSQ